MGVDLGVSLDILHTFDSDLAATLISPVGTRVVLFSGVGGSGDNFTGTRLTDGASLSINAGSAPFTGNFQPQQPLSRLLGEPLTGTWTLEITDFFGGFQGTLETWALDAGETVFASSDVPSARRELGGRWAGAGGRGR